MLSLGALIMVNAMLAMASPMPAPAPTAPAQLDKRTVYVKTAVKVETVYVYPDGSPAYGYKPEDTSNDRPFVYYHEEEQEPEPEPEPEPAPVYKEPAAPKPPPKQEPAPQPNYGDDGGSSAGSYPAPNGDFKQTSLYHHNMHRSNHSSPDVAWDDRLAAAAQQLANSCNYGHNTNLQGGGYGQNIAMKAGTNDLGSEAHFIAQSISDMWYNSEIKLYGNAYGYEPSMSNFHDWGHFSQIVWAGSTKIGCAVAKCNPGSGLSQYPGYYSVCNYEPAGNMGGAYGKNVHPPQGKATLSA